MSSPFEGPPPAPPRRHRAAGRRFLAALCTMLLVGSLTLVAYRAGEERAAADESALPADLAPLADLYERIQRDAVRVPDDDALLEGAIEGMLGTLDDPYAAYYGIEDFAAFNQLLDGQFSGVGIVVEEAPEGLTVASVLDGTPAADAGVEPGELIVSVDGKDVRDLPSEGIVGLITGEAGTDVTVGFSGGEAGPRELRMTRAEIALPDVDQRLLEDGLGYVQLLQFSQAAGDRVRDATEELVAQGARGIVLDLRGNPGGLLGEAVDVASVFVEDGLVVSVRSRQAEGELRPAAQEYTAQGDALEDLPLVVLVDEGSASASEIVAGAVQDLDRGEIVGQATFGKGTVQTVQVLRDGAGVKFTTAEYFTPSGDSIEGVGVIPDREIEDPDAQLAAAQEALRSLVAGAAA